MPKQSATVLVVDDDPAVRSVLSRTMEAAGYSVHSAADGLEALTLLANAVPVHLVVTDIQMPRMDGRELSAELAAKYPHVRVLFISGYDAHLGSDNLLGPVLAKPFRAEILIETVQGMLVRQQRLA